MHRDDCPTPWEARQRGRRDEEEQSYARNPYRSTYDNDGCEDAARQWERGRGDAEYEREEQERRDQEEQRMEQRRQEEEYQLEQFQIQQQEKWQARQEAEQEEPETDEPQEKK